MINKLLASRLEEGFECRRRRCLLICAPLIAIAPVPFAISLTTRCVGEILVWVVFPHVPKCDVYSTRASSGVLYKYKGGAGNDTVPWVVSPQFFLFLIFKVFRGWNLWSLYYFILCFVYFYYFLNYSTQCHFQVAPPIEIPMRTRGFGVDWNSQRS